MTRTFYSIGHSSQSIDAFIELLYLHRIEVVADVRSHPVSRFAPQFNSESLREHLRGRNIRYVSLGRELGGRPSDARFYDPEGYVLYSEIAESPAFLEGIRRLEKGVREFRVAIMCSEEDPCSCHRRLLVGRVMAAHGCEVRHVRVNGQVQSEEDLVKEESRRASPTLFPVPWRSVFPLRQRQKGFDTVETQGQ